MKFRDAKIKTKLLMGFGIVLFVTVIIILTLIASMNNIAQTTQRMYDQPYAASQSIWSLRRNILDTQNQMNRLVSLDNTEILAQKDSIQATIDADVQQVQTDLQALQAMFTSADKQQMLADISTQLTACGQIRTQVVNLATSNQLEAAQQLLRQDYDTALNNCLPTVLELAEIISDDAAAFVVSAHTYSRSAFILGLVLLFVGIACMLSIATVLSNAIVGPARQLEKAAAEMSRGNLNAVDLVTYHSKDAMGQLADSLRVTMTNLSQYVDEISSVLTRLAQGDLTIDRNHITDYLGDFSEIKTSFVTILKSFNHTLGEIHDAGEQVDTGSAQSSSAAQMLAQGATEQASAVDELTETMSEISSQIQENAKHTSQADALAARVSKEVAEGSQHMQQLNGAMDEIRNSSQEIGKIIKTIEDIAFQTNILALNAAVEAARAGAAGKGFAVVADEVRNLAGKSAEASKNTTALIENSVRAVENGAAIAETTTQSLELVEQTTKQVVDTIQRIAQASEKQAHSVAEVTTRVEQISTVVQKNSATAEESAAASEELSSQADRLNQMVSRFKLYQETRAITSGTNEA